ncbi:thermonuclease family protein [Nitrobacter sp.]|jgi:endonuclease YncB( thermonuclease family)|uniref:thermonuclease family protein n=1 Tax=Nitrobacter sp. TaxID=29420 RepID=UPI0029CAB718|nr:thermonuclease family protein [Nitrobacter sp.]
MKRILAILVITLLARSALAADLVGQSTVIDGDTLEIHGTRIRLWGIDAPESSQLCRGEDSLPFRCGAKAANALDGLIGGRPVRCTPVSTDQYGRTVASCMVDGVDLASWLVSHGLALDWPQYSNGRYRGSQQEAVRAGQGIWAGSFVMPWLYRRCIDKGGRPSGCSDDATTYGR